MMVVGYKLLGRRFKGLLFWEGGSKASSGAGLTVIRVSAGCIDIIPAGGSGVAYLVTVALLSGSLSSSRRAGTGVEAILGKRASHIGYVF